MFIQLLIFSFFYSFIFSFVHSIIHSLIFSFIFVIHSVIKYSVSVCPSSVCLLFQDSNDDNESMSSTAVETSNATTATVVPKQSGRKRKSRKSRHEWEILEGLKEGQVCEDKPDKYQGFLLKRRKWPLKGWHKVTEIRGKLGFF